MSDDLDSKNFSNEPISISTLRANKYESSRAWTPRDVLIDALRKIDSGEIAPASLIVCWNKMEADGTGYSDYYVSSPDVITTLGMLARTNYRLNRNMDTD